MDLQPRGSGGYPEKSRSSFNPEKRSDYLCHIFVFVGFLLVRFFKIPFPFSFLCVFSQIRKAQFHHFNFSLVIFGGCRLALDF